MKISLDSMWCKILDEDRDEVLLKLGTYEYSPFMERILSPSQFRNSMDNDGTYKLSKKAEKILLEEIERRKTQKP